MDIKLGELNFLEYLGYEEQHLLAGIVNYRNEFDLFYNLDRIYQEPLKRLSVSSDDAVVSQLYLFVHFHLYFSMSCFLRSHLSEALSSVRKAIDSTLCAYKIILNPQTAKGYINREKYFQYIKNNIQKEIIKVPSTYPLAHDLINIHNLCSEYGSHADISSFIHRFETKETTNEDQRLLLLHYFQLPRDFEEYRFYYITILCSFHSMFLVFKLFLDQKLKILDSKWELTIQELGLKLSKDREREL